MSDQRIDLLDVLIPDPATIRHHLDRISDERDLLEQLLPIAIEKEKRRQQKKRPKEASGS